ncbi:hypothetical protein SRABI84_03473 [Peribacillus simplex]|uniref:hypothetical protein n=1 Tax=Peribacillus simplex TaxID=1478 RepID=UPI001D81A032|nr:hypothetical protein SRABI84_03473 [Peribacillus simplex]
MVVLAVSCALVALVAAVAVVAVVDADAAEGAAVVADVADVKVSGLLKKSPCVQQGLFFIVLDIRDKLSYIGLK